jgi:hypothetical protein
MRNLDNSYALGYNIVASSGAVAQMGERYNRTVEVRGSNPLSSTFADDRGPWRSWERVSMALRRSRVRVPLGPPNNSKLAKRAEQE